HFRVNAVEGNIVADLSAEEGLVGSVDDGNRRLLGCFRDFLGNDVIHPLVLLHPLFGGVAGGGGGVLVVVRQVAYNAAAAEDEQQNQQGNLLFGKVQAGFAVVGQLHPVGDGLHEGQENGQQYGLNGEHEQILENLGHGQYIALSTHHYLIVQ